MEKFFSIGETARKLEITSETLRHYDRIGLASPSHRDSVTGYRYYSEDDIILISTIKLLQQMDMPLEKIKKMLTANDFKLIVGYLDEACKNAEEKIKGLENAKSQIQRAKEAYISKINTSVKSDYEIIEFEKRVILLSKTLYEPTIENLFSYQKNYWEQLDSKEHKYFSFENEAGIYTDENRTSLYVPCIKFKPNLDIRTLPKGKYLCVYSDKEEVDEKLKKSLVYVEKLTSSKPKFVIKKVVLSGILNWNYEIQIPIFDS